MNKFLESNSGLRGLLAELVGEYLTFQDFVYTGAKVRNLIACGVCFRENFDGATLVNAVLERADLQAESDTLRVSLRYVVAVGAYLAHASMSTAGIIFTPGADCTGAVFTNACFRHADLRGTTFDSADLRWADFGGTNMTRVQFADADIRGAAFVGAKLGNVNLQQTNCTGANFTGAWMFGAILEGVDLSRLTLNAAEMCHAHMDACVLRGMTISNARFSEARLRSADFSGAALRDIDFTGTWLHSAIFRGVTITDADFGGQVYRTRTSAAPRSVTCHSIMRACAVSAFAAPRLLM